MNPSVQHAISHDHRLPIRAQSDLSTLADRVWAARVRGIRTVTVVVEASAHDLLPEVRRTLTPLQRKLRGVRLGVEARARLDGRLELPADVRGVDSTVAFVDTIEVAGEEVGPATLREGLDEGRLSALDVIRALGERWVDVLRVSGQVLVHRPFELLTLLGIPERWVPMPLIRAMAELMEASGSSILVDESLRSPRPGTLRSMAAAGIDFKAGSGAPFVSTVGRYSYVRSALELARAVPVVSTPGSGLGFRRAA